jgi:hypothetical protein
LGSQTKPLLEVRVEILEHPFFDDAGQKFLDGAVLPCIDSSISPLPNRIGRAHETDRVKMGCLPHRATERFEKKCGVMKANEFASGDSSSGYGTPFVQLPSSNASFAQRAPPLITPHRYKTFANSDRGGNSRPVGTFQFWTSFERVEVKTKQLPADFRDWLDAPTFTIDAGMTLRSGPPQAR